MIVRRSFIVTTVMIDALLICGATLQFANTHSPMARVSTALAVGVIALSAAWAAIIVWWRERAPFAANVALACAAFVVAFIALSAPSLMSIFIAAYAAARYNGDRVSALLVALICVAALLVSGLFGQIAWPGVVMLGLALVIAGLLGLWRRTVLEKRVETLELQRQLMVSDAISQERSRIAAELHDSVAHSLAVVTAQAQGASRIVMTDPQRAKTALDAISDASRQAQREIRITLGQLDGDAVDAVESIDAAVAAAAAAGLTVSLGDVTAIASLDPTRQFICYRAIQESLTNAIKHSGTGSMVSVRMHEDGSWLVLQTDCVHGPRRSGSGAPASHAGGGRGLSGLARRASEAGGSLETSASAESFSLKLRLPRRSLG